VHLNFPFEKPLEPSVGGGDPASEELLDAFHREHPRAAFGRPAGEPYVRVSRKSQTASEDEVERLSSLLRRARRGVIVAGPTPDAGFVGPAVLSLGAATGFPVLADPLSGARFLPGGGATVVGGYDLFLRSPRAREALAPDLVLRVGGSPTSSGALEYMAEQGNAPQVVVDDGHRWKDHLASAHAYLPTAPVPLLEQAASRAASAVDPEWLNLWREAEAGTREVLAARRVGALLEGEIAEEVASGLPEGANLLVASSMPIRDLDAFAFPRDKALTVFGNRGVSGIDGLVSTTLGIAMGSTGPEGPRGPHQVRSQAHVPTAALLGDLAFFHDMNGLLALRDLRPWVVLVVVNNDGGGIFHTLPVREHEPAFTRLFATPHGLDFRRAADLYDLPHAGTDSLVGFRRVFAEALGTPGPSIVEVRTRREDTHAGRREVVAAVVRAMDRLGRGPEA
jgi:2-succinyl-5-enolpyruvyl-6-hydroxy-3-cyclohexene-1-carboxylate synthase